MVWRKETGTPVGETAVRGGTMLGSESAFTVTVLGGEVKLRAGVPKLPRKVWEMTVPAGVRGVADDGKEARSSNSHPTILARLDDLCAPRSILRPP